MAFAERTDSTSAVASAPESDGGPSQTTLRIAAACSVLAAILYTLLWIIAGQLEDNYDNLRQDISDFGALTATHPTYNITIVLTGMLLIAFAAGLFAAIRRPLLARIGVVVLLPLAICQLLDGVFREDCSPSGNPYCRAALDAGTLSWHQQAHDLESIAWFASIIVAPLLLGLAFRRMSEWTWLVLPSFAAAAISAGALTWYFILYFGNDGSAYSGVLERAVAVTDSAGRRSSQSSCGAPPSPPDRAVS